MIKQRWRKTKVNKDKTCSNCYRAVPYHVRREWHSKKVFCDDDCYDIYWTPELTEDDWYNPFHPINVMDRKVSND